LIAQFPVELFGVSKVVGERDKKAHGYFLITFRASLADRPMQEGRLWPEALLVPESESELGELSFLPGSALFGGGAAPGYGFGR
jgi:hypothetical protein